MWRYSCKNNNWLILVGNRRLILGEEEKVAGYNLKPVICSQIFLFQMRSSELGNTVMQKLGKWGKFMVNDASTQ